MGRIGSTLFKVFGIGLAVLLVTIGLAYAGVKVPGADLLTQSDSGEDSTKKVEAAEDDESKDQDSHKAEGEGGNAVSDAVHEVIEARDGGGCEFGHAVAAAAHEANQGDQDSEVKSCDHEESNESNGHQEKNDRAAKDHEKKEKVEHESNGDERANANAEARDDDAEENDDDDDDVREDKVKEDHGSDDDHGHDDDDEEDDD